MLRNGEQIFRFILIGVISLMGCCGFGFALDYNLDEKTQATGLSTNDSIALEIAEVLKEGANLSDIRRKHIENRISTFPGRVIRRDTASYYLQTVLTVAYNEFVTEDFDKALASANKFSQEVVDADALKSLVRFSVIKFTPSDLETKRKHKENPSDDPNSLINSTNSFEYSRDSIQFFADIFAELPLDLNLWTYKSL